MSLNAHSSEFTRLVTAWLDETATAEQMEQLWQAVAESPECAAEFASAARFEALLGETVQERAGEKTFLTQLVAGEAKSPKRAAQVIRGWRQASPLRAAAAIALLGLVTWLLWPAAEAPQVAQISPPKPKATTLVSPQKPTSPAQRSPLVSPALTQSSTGPEKPLLDRLDSFFLAGVNLNQVSLREALGMLQGQLQELNFLNAEALKKLRITVPSDAASRRITFNSGPIAFLKAVRAVAALGGCDLTIDESTLALNLYREIYPQVPERRDLRHVLAGRVNADGSDAASDPGRLAELMADAASLGIAIDPSQPMDAQSSLLVTRGQWTALQMLTDTREQIRKLPAQNYQLYYSDGTPSPMNQVINQDKVVEMQKHFQRIGAEPVAVLKPALPPQLAATSPIPNLPTVNTQPLGEVTEVTVTWPSAMAMNNTDTTPAQPGVAPGQLLTYTVSMSNNIVFNGLLAGGQGFTLSSSVIGNLYLRGDAKFSGIPGMVLNNASNSSSANGDLVILPVPNPSQP